MTEDEKKAAEANALATAQEEERKRKEAEANAKSPEQIRIEELEKEKAAILERETNYKLAYLKEKKKNDGANPDETDEERIRRITREELANKEIAAIDKEKEELFKKTLRENSELKLAIKNKIPDKPSGGTHNEIPEVKDTILTDEQLAALRARGWTDKDIERYKKNYRKNQVR